MSHHRDKSPWRRVFSWKRIILFAGFCVLLYMIVKTPRNGPQKTQRQTNKDLLKEWDEETIKLFKKQLHIDTALEQEVDLASCSDLWDEQSDYLIITGFLGYSGADDDLQSHLWLYFNLLALEKVENMAAPNVLFLLPLKTKQTLEKVFESVAFGDLSMLVRCEKHVKIDELLKFSRVVGHFDEIGFEDKKSSRKKQLVILNEGTKRLQELADFDFSFVPYRPLFTQEIVQKTRSLMGRGNVPLVGDYSAEEGREESPSAVVDTVVALNFIGVYVDQRDNVSTE